MDGADVTYRVIRGHDDEEGVPGVETFVIDESLGYLVNVTARLFAAALGRRLAQHGIGIGQWPVLVFLWNQDGLTQTELSERIPLDGGTVARTLDRMERDDLVRRERDPRDRRQINVFLTEKGRELRDRLLPYAQEVNALAAEGADPAAVAGFQAHLRRMMVNLRRDEVDSVG